MATRRTMTGTVVSDKMDKSITVHISRRVRHPLYGKYILKSTRICAHDEENSGKPGDVVSIEECRPLSRRKSWRLLCVVSSKTAEGSR